VNGRRWLLAQCLFVAPAVVLFAAFVYYPFLSGLRYALTQWDGITPPVDVGLANFGRVFDDPALLDAARNTLWFVLATLFLYTPLSLCLGLALDRPLRGRGALRTMFYLPVVLAPLVVGVVWTNLLGYYGTANAILSGIGLGSLVRDWLGSTATALPSLIFIGIWGTGFGAVIFLAGLQSIPPELTEAATIDGAGAWSTFRRVTFPLLMPAVTINVFLGLTGALKVFDLPYVMTNGGPGDSTTTVALYVYNLAFRDSVWGYAAAIGVVFFLVILCIASAQLLITRRLEVQF